MKKSEMMPILYNKPWGFIIVTLILATMFPLLGGCKSEEAKLEQQREEQRKELLAPRKEKVDPQKAKNYDPYK